MSVEATAATWKALPAMRQALVEQIPDPRRRPAFKNVIVVALLLADKYRPSRGYANETLPQILEATVVLTENEVRSALDALHRTGYWVREAKGNQRGGTRRRPGKFLTEHRGEAPPDPDEDDDAGASWGSSPLSADPEHRGDDTGASWGEDTSIVGKLPATPHTTPCTTPKEREAGSGPLVAQYADEVPALLEGLNLIYGPAAVRDEVERFEDAGARFRFPSELVAALKTSLSGLGSFDLADHAPGPAVSPLRAKDPTRFDVTDAEDGAPVAALPDSSPYDRTPAERRAFLDTLKEGTA